MVVGLVDVIWLKPPVEWWLMRFQYNGLIANHRQTTSRSMTISWRHWSSGSRRYLSTFSQLLTINGQLQSQRVLVEGTGRVQANEILVQSVDYRPLIRNFKVDDHWSKASVKCWPMIIQYIWSTPYHWWETSRSTYSWWLTWSCRLALVIRRARK